MNELIGFIKRQYRNFLIFRAYSVSSILKELFLFPKDMISNSGKSSNILNIALFITMRCNAKCAMCNITGVLNDRRMPDIPLEKIEQLLDDVKHYHPSIILFGGEPFVRGDIVDIVKAVKKRGLAVGMFTNGTLLNEGIINELIKEKLDYIAFSLLGSKEVHDKVLSVPGAYDKMVSAIGLFVKTRPRATRVVTHTTICESNVNDLKNIARLSLDLGVDLVRFGHPTFYSAQELSHCSAALKNVFGEGEEARAMSYVYDISGKEGLYLEKIRELVAAFGEKVSFTPELSDKERESWYSPDFKSNRRCLFMMRGSFIYPNGDMYPCESISYRMGNVFDDGFSGAWNGPRYRAFRRALKKGLMPACARCCKL